MCNGVTESLVWSYSSLLLTHLLGSSSPCSGDWLLWRKAGCGTLGRLRAVVGLWQEPQVVGEWLLPTVSAPLQLIWGTLQHSQMDYGWLVMVHYESWEHHTLPKTDEEKGKSESSHENSLPHLFFPVQIIRYEYKQMNVRHDIGIHSFELILVCESPDCEMESHTRWTNPAPGGCEGVREAPGQGRAPQGAWKRLWDLGQAEAHLRRSSVSNSCKRCWTGITSIVRMPRWASALPSPSCRAMRRCERTKPVLTALPKDSLKERER